MVTLYDLSIYRRFTRRREGTYLSVPGRCSLLVTSPHNATLELLKRFVTVGVDVENAIDYRQAYS